MYPAIGVSLSCLMLAILLGLLLLYFRRDAKKRRKQKEERLRQQVRELTGKDLAQGPATVKDLEKLYGRKG